MPGSVVQWGLEQQSSCTHSCPVLPLVSPGRATQAHAQTLQILLAGRDKSRNPRQCLRVELARKQTMMYYQPQPSRLFLKIVLAVPTLVAGCRSESVVGTWQSHVAFHTDKVQPQRCIWPARAPGTSSDREPDWG